MTTNNHKHLVPILLSLLLSLFSNNSLAQSSPAEAAEVARQDTGGKVLKVKKQKNNHYRVKVLLPTGQVNTLTIQHQAKKK